MWFIVHSEIYPTLKTSALTLVAEKGQCVAPISETYWRPVCSEPLPTRTGGHCEQTNPGLNLSKKSGKQGEVEINVFLQNSNLLKTEATKTNLNYAWGVGGHFTSVIFIVLAPVATLLVSVD